MGLAQQVCRPRVVHNLRRSKSALAVQSMHEETSDTLIQFIPGFTMLIVADENIPLLDAFFAGWGEIRRVPGRRMTAVDVAGADVLLVRSVTRVDALLLAKTRPRFVGTATIGIDHIDVGWLEAQGIPFAAAPGCNARAVAEYVATVLMLFAEQTDRSLAGQRLGVVGYGNVGRAVVALGRVLGMEIGICDPLLEPVAMPDGVARMDLDELCNWADVLTLHVPMTTIGQAPTRHLLDGGRLAQGRWALLINTARGAVVDNTALEHLLELQPHRRVVLDVWEREPIVPASLLSKVWLGTPHIAGYSAEGKWRGTEQIYRAACAVLGRQAEVRLPDVLAARGDAPQPLNWKGTLARTLTGCCPVVDDTARLRHAAGNDAQVAPAMFDALRREYPERREFAHFVVKQANVEKAGGRDAVQDLADKGAETATPQGAAALLRKLGFSGDD